MPGQCGSDLDSTTDCVTLASHGISLSLSFPTCKQNMLTALPWLGSGKITDTNASHNSKRSHFHTQSSPICILTLVTSSSLPSPAPSWPQLMKLSPLQGSSLESLGGLLLWSSKPCNGARGPSPDSWQMPLLPCLVSFLSLPQFLQPESCDLCICTSSSQHRVITFAPC